MPLITDKWSQAFMADPSQSTLTGELNHKIVSETAKLVERANNTCPDDGDRKKILQAVDTLIQNYMEQAARINSATDGPADAHRLEHLKNRTLKTLRRVPKTERASWIKVNDSWEPIFPDRTHSLATSLGKAPHFPEAIRNALTQNALDELHQLIETYQPPLVSPNRPPSPSADFFTFYPPGHSPLELHLDARGRVLWLDIEGQQYDCTHPDCNTRFPMEAAQAIHALQLQLDSSEIERGHSGVVRLPNADYWDKTWEKGERKKVYNIIEKRIITTIKELYFDESLLPRMADGRLCLLELFAGKGGLAESIIDSFPEPVVYIGSDRSGPSVAEGQKRLGDKATWIEGDALQMDYEEELLPLGVAPGVVIISGGLTWQVLATREEALDILKKVATVLPENGIVILSGLQPLILNGNTVERSCGLRILSRSSGSRKLSQRPDTVQVLGFQVLQKPPKEATHSIEAVNGSLDLFRSYQDSYHPLWSVLNSLEDADAITSLDISHCNIHRDDLPAIGGYLPHLKTLRMRGPKVTWGDIQALGPDLIKQLEVLDIGGCQITSHQVVALSKLARKLQKIVLDHCPNVTVETQVILRAKLALNTNPEKPDLSFMRYVADSQQKCSQAFLALARTCAVYCKSPSARIDLSKTRISHKELKVLLETGKLQGSQIILNNCMMLTDDFWRFLMGHHIQAGTFSTAQLQDLRGLAMVLSGLHQLGSARHNLSLTKTVTTLHLKNFAIEEYNLLSLAKASYYFPNLKRVDLSLPKPSADFPALADALCFLPIEELFIDGDSSCLEILFAKLKLNSESQLAKSLMRVEVTSPQTVEAPNHIKILHTPITQPE